MTAIDAAPAFIERLRARADRARLGDRIEASVGHMESLPFADGAFDVVWSEGAIYTMGFEAGLRAWRRLLRPEDLLVVSELTWTTGSRPADVESYWTTAYPGISTVSTNIRTLEQSGYRPLAFFFLPADCWGRNYYDPLRAAFHGFLERREHGADARRIVESEEAEIRLHSTHGAWYGYAFYVARRTAASDGIGAV